MRTKKQAPGLNKNCNTRAQRRERQTRQAVRASAITLIGALPCRARSFARRAQVRANVFDHDSGSTSSLE